MVEWVRLLKHDIYVAIGYFLRKNIYAALFAIFVIGPITWVAMDREPPFLLTEGHTIPAKIRHGELFQLQWKYYNLPRRCPGIIYLYLRDSSGKIWVGEPMTAAFGLITEDSVEIKGTLISGHKRVMPDDIAPGPAKIYLTNDFYCNFTQYLWPLRVSFGPVDTVVLD